MYGCDRIVFMRCSQHPNLSLPTGYICGREAVVSRCITADLESDQAALGVQPSDFSSNTCFRPRRGMTGEGGAARKEIQTMVK